MFARRFLAAVLVLVGLTAAVPAQAQWRRADTPNFIIYSDGSERNLREYATTLERFDALLRLRFQKPAGEEIRKLPVYLVGDDRALRMALPSLPEGIDGYYSAGDADIFAILIRGERDDLLKHEYVHHFMAQAGETRFPGWLSEGIADYFATATVPDRGKASFGLPNPGRQQALAQRRWLPMDRVLAARGSFDLTDREGREMFYNQSWLLTHWLFADAERVVRLGRYLAAVSEGQDGAAAWQSVYGMSTEALADALKSYLRGRIFYAQMDLPPINPDISIRVLEPSAQAVILPAIAARRYDATEAEGAAALAALRQASARFPDDPRTLIALGRAETRWGDEAAGERALSTALERDPANTEGLLLMADILTDRAYEAETNEARVAQLREVNALLKRAIDADPTDYRVYAALARVRRNEPTYPSSNDLQTWAMAVHFAPQVLSIRGDAAMAFLRADRSDEAGALLAPMINDPHGGANARRARELMQRVTSESEPADGSETSLPPDASAEPSEQ